MHKFCACLKNERKKIEIDIFLVANFIFGGQISQVQQTQKNIVINFNNFIRLSVVLSFNLQYSKQLKQDVLGVPGVLQEQTWI